MADFSSICLLTDKLASWEAELKEDHDGAFLQNGIRHGFRWVLSIAQTEYAASENYQIASSQLAKSAIDRLISQELAERKVSLVPTKPFRVNAIGALAKKSSSAPRPITDCSRPLGGSVKSYLTAQNITFQSIEEVTS